MSRRALGPVFGAPRRGFAWAAIGVAVAVTLSLGPDAVGDERILWALSDPTAATLRELAGRPGFDVRWVERGLVLVETGGEVSPPSTWRPQRLAVRAPDLELGILRAGDVAAWRKPGGEHAPAARLLESARVARLDADAGEVWLLLEPPSGWPAEAVGCHGGIILAKHGLDPRSGIDAGPPAVLAPYVAAARRPLSGAERRVLADISGDSILANLQRLSLDAFSRPADRYVWNSDLELIYGPRVETVMQRAVAGIPGAQVRRQWYAPRASTPADTTFNVIARLPGSVPGTGTFVVCAHLDAIGIRDPAWQAAIAQHQPVQTPGAEDNATGVACVLEMLRATADAVRTGQVDFAFDLEFIAFSAEEIGLLGSEYYVRQGAADGTAFLGTFNFDMVGYDSLVGNLQVVRNPASTWLSDLVQTAAAGLSPATTLDLTPEIDESRSSDHNSFWIENGPAILLADADVNTLRRYPTYHTPGDVLGRPPTVRTRIEVPKLVEVSRLLQAALLRFDTQAYTQPLLQFSPEDLSLRREIQGVSVHYDPKYHQLWPGAALDARLAVQSLGAPFAAPLHIQMQTSGTGGGQTVFDSTAVWSLPTGARAEVVHRIVIPSGARDMQLLNAIVTYEDSTGAPVVQTAQDTFYVQTPGTLNALVRPNPTKGDPAVAKVAFEVSAPGEVRVEVYDLEGQRVSVSSRSVVPVTFSKLELPVVDSSPGGIGADLASGAYLVRILWTGSTGGSASAMARWVVIR